MGPARTASDILHEARARERSGCIAEAMETYDQAIVAAEAHGEKTVLAEALRRLAILHHRRDQISLARELCKRSYEVACTIGNNLLAGDALNTLGAQHLETGSLDEARRNFSRALELAGENRDLRARADVNLGILANIQGDLDAAQEFYAGALQAYREAGNEHGCAMAYHNLGMVSADRDLLDESEAYFGQSLEIAERAGDPHLQGICLVERANVYVARQRFEEAQRNAESALALFDQLGARGAKADAYRVIGVVYRETGRPALAESRLRSALELAVVSGSALNEAEVSRELALLYQSMGRNQEALRLLNAAHKIFGKLDARRELIHVDGKVSELEGTYMTVVRDWGQSIESSDTYTYGHCERVASISAALGAALGLEGPDLTAIRLGAYLHDVGKVKVPHEILNKPGPLTRDEFEVIQMHTIWGIELLDSVEFPWDIKPIIRWHHEKYDGSGYPDRLKGDQIPVAAQVVGIADVYDALTTTRAYRGAMTHKEAVAEIRRCRSQWSPEVFTAFELALPEVAAVAQAEERSAA